ncbi:hypothetical protein [Streptomyces sp. NPDC057253]|uniref:hypothetical protein n=1 Tax=Streptomyces sp. NPDC057253 TaxID=3346069 RepID=UPI003634A6EF
MTAVEHAIDSANDAEKALSAQPPEMLSAKTKASEVRSHVDEADRLATLISLEGSSKVAEYSRGIISGLEDWASSLESWVRAAENGKNTTRYANDAAEGIKAANRWASDFMKAAKEALAA